ARGTRTSRGAAPWLGGSVYEEAPQDVLQDPAVAEVVALLRRFQPHSRTELLFVRAHSHLVRLAVLEAGDRELLAAGQAEALAVLAVHELQGHDSAHEQVRAVDPLVALGDRGRHAEH